MSGAAAGGEQGHPLDLPSLPHAGWRRTALTVLPSGVGEDGVERGPPGSGV
jgi:hypothetical protein